MQALLLGGRRLWERALSLQAGGWQRQPGAEAGSRQAPDPAAPAHDGGPSHHLTKAATHAACPLCCLTPFTTTQADDVLPAHWHGAASQMHAHREPDVCAAQGLGGGVDERIAAAQPAPGRLRSAQPAQRMPPHTSYQSIYC